MSDSACRDVGDGKPVKVRKCSLCGVAPANVDDCGEFGNPKCPCFGIKKDNIMTTELKPCPFCGGKKHLIIDDYHDLEMDGYFGFNVICNAAGWGGADKGCGVAGAWGETKEEAANIWNTRAVPDVTELVRYKPDSYDAPSISRMLKDEEGGYVRYDQASAMLAAKDEEIKRLKNHLDDRKAHIFYLDAEVKARKVKNKRLRKALETLVDRISYYASLAEEGIPNIEDWAYTDNSGDIAKAREALEGVDRG